MCEKIDIKNKRVVHTDDFIDIMNQLLPLNTISRREYHYMIGVLRSNKSMHVSYDKLETVMMSDHRYRHQQLEQEEVWYDGAGSEGGDIDEARAAASKAGSIGEWLIS